MVAPRGLSFRRSGNATRPIPSCQFVPPRSAVAPRSAQWAIAFRRDTIKCRTRQARRLPVKIKTCGVISTLFRVFFLISNCAPVGIAGTVVLEGARLIDGTGNPPIEKSVLVIEGNRIKAVGAMGSVPIPEGARVIDLGGKTVIPALINLHGHVGLTRGLEQAAANYNEENIRAQLEKYLAYGVGTVVSLGNDQDLIYSLRERQRAGELPGARLYTAGRGFGLPGGYPPGLASPADRYRPQTPEQAPAEGRGPAPHHPPLLQILGDDGVGRS